MKVYLIALIFMSHNAFAMADPHFIPGNPPNADQAFSFNDTKKSPEKSQHDQQKMEDKKMKQQKMEEQRSEEHPKEDL